MSQNMAMVKIYKPKKSQQEIISTLLLLVKKGSIMSILVNRVKYVMIFPIFP